MRPVPHVVDHHQNTAFANGLGQLARRSVDVTDHRRLARQRYGSTGNRLQKVWRLAKLDQDLTVMKSELYFGVARDRQR